jgi:putative lipoprotein
MNEQRQTRVVRGDVVVPEAGAPEEAAELVVQVEDVSRADAPSVVVGEQRLRGVRLPPGGALQFEVEVPADRVDPHSMYSVRAHVDVSGSGEVEKGDLLSTRSYPVLTRGHGDEAQVEVQQI